MPAKIDLTGQKFGRLTAVRESGRNRHGAVLWACVCDCDPKIEVHISCASLRSGNASSCGCFRKERIRDAVVKRCTKHGQSYGRGKKGSKLYRAWAAIKRRCNTPSCSAYPWYGGRGVRVCAGITTSFELFESLIKTPPNPSMEIDRRDNDGHYSCGQCNECIEHGWTFNLRWVDHATNVRNSRKVHLISVNGETKPITDWAKQIGIPHSTLIARLKRGWTAEAAITTPSQRRNKQVNNST